MCRLRDSLQALGGAGSIARRPVVRPPGVVAARRRESRSSPSPTPSTSARCVTPGSSESSTARSATPSPAGWAPAATVLAVTSRSRSPSSSSRNSSRHVSVKRRHEGGDQRAGIEGRSPRSHPQVLTISPIPITLPSQWFGFSLVEQAIARGATVVMTRGSRQWTVAVPALMAYERVVRLKSPQEAAISPRNCGDQGWETILDALSGEHGHRQ